jgi:hypothetical protein
MVLILLLLTLLPAAAVGMALGAGRTAVVGGLVALFALIAFLGGPLRDDLRIAAALSPLFLMGAVVPPLLAAWSPPLAIAVVVLIVFAASALPMRGARFSSAGLGIAMATLFSYGFAVSYGPSAGPLVLSVVIGLIVAVLLRLLFAAGDPSKVTRQRVAAVLTGDGEVSSAVETWLADGRPVWLGTVLGEAARFRALVRQATAGADAASVADLERRAGLLADRLRAKPAKAAAMPVGQWPATGGSSVLVRAGHCLDAIEAAMARRDTAPVPAPGRRARAWREALVRPAGRLRSVQLRHAVRTSLGMLLLLVVVELMPLGDPLAATALMAGFAILQASWHATLAKSWQRVSGVVVGALASFVVIAFLPPSLLIPVAVLALCVGLWFVASRPAVGYGFLVLVSVGFNATRADPFELLIEYVVLVLIAVAIAVAIGFTVVPALRPASVPVRAEEARVAARALLSAQRTAGTADSESVLVARRRAEDAAGQLVPDHERLTDGQTAGFAELHDAVQDLAALSDVLTREGAKADLAEAERLLDAPASATTAPARDRDPLGAALSTLAERIRTVAGRLSAA